jgi:hypothetical protein
LRALGPEGLRAAACRPSAGRVRCTDREG